MILDDIKKGESEKMEFEIELLSKSEKFLKTILGFANTSGGTLIIGVSDEREIIGVDTEEVFQIMDNIINAISDNCIPQIHPNISFQTIENKCIVIIQIFPGAYRPYYLKAMGKDHGSYIRIGSTTRVADEIKVRELEMEGSNVSWDECILIGYDATEETIECLCNNITNYMQATLLPLDERRVIPRITQEHLFNWKVLKQNRDNLYATNSFALLMGIEFPFSKIQCALFKGNDRDIFIDKKEYNGPLYTQIEEAYQYVLQHINIGAKIEGLVRKDTYELPLGAIRELIVNAVTHRNYMDPSCVQVALYDNRLEVTSPGALYGGLTLEEALNGRSNIRNRAIAKVFNRLEIIESWGSGMKRIQTQVAAHGLKKPEFILIGDTFRVNIYRDYIEKADKTSIEKKDKKPINKADKKPINKADKKPIKIERQHVIIAYLKRNGSITNSEARELLHLADSTTKRILMELVSTKTIIEHGNLKSRKYILIEAGTNKNTSFKIDEKPINKADKKPINKADKKPIKIERQRHILEYIKHNDSITNKEARELLHLADSTIKRELKRLVSDGILEEHGILKAKKYFLRKD